MQASFKEAQSVIVAQAVYVDDFNNSGGPVWVAVDWIRFRTDTNLLLIGQ